MNIRRLHIESHTITRYCQRIDRISREDARETILKHIETGREATREEREFIIMSRAGSRHGSILNSKHDPSRIIISGNIAFVIIDKAGHHLYDSVVITCYECDYLHLVDKSLSTVQIAQPPQKTAKSESLRGRCNVDPQEVWEHYKSGGVVIIDNVEYDIKLENDAIHRRRRGTDKIWKPLNTTSRYIELKTELRRE